MTHQATITYYGASNGGRQSKYHCSRCNSPLTIVSDYDETLLVCTGCKVQVGYSRRLPDLPIRGQTELKL